MKQILCIFLCVLTFFPASAKEKGKQVNFQCNNTPKVQMFHGHGVAKDKEIALKNAENDAKRQASNYVYEDIASVVNVSQDFNNDKSTADVLINSEVSLSGGLPFQDHCVLNEKTEAFECQVCFGYDKDVLDKETKRIEKSKNKGGKGAVTTIGTDITRGSVFIDTNGIIANVDIDGKKYGDSPLKIIGKLSEGEHILKVSSLYYEDFTAYFDINANKKTHVKVSLQKGFGSLAVNSSIDGADVYINGTWKGKTPFKHGRIQAGKVLLKVSHKESETITKEIQLTKNEKRVENINLTPKKAVISISSNPNGAKIFIDKKFIDKVTPISEYILKPGKHLITLQKDGVGSVSQEVTLKGGEEKPIILDITDSSSKNKEVDFEDNSFKNVVILPNRGLVDFEKFNGNFIKRHPGYSFIIPKVTYKPKFDSVDFSIRLKIDEKLYQKFYSEPLKSIVKKGTNSEVESVKLRTKCFTEGDDYCGVAFDDNHLAYIRHGSFNKKGTDFYRFSNIGSPVGKNDFEKISNMSVFVGVFDKKERHVLSFELPFYMMFFKKIGDKYIFNPILSSRNTFDCRGNFGENVCGTLELNLRKKMPYADPNMIDKIYVSIGVSDW